MDPNFVCVHVYTDQDIGVVTNLAPYITNSASSLESRLPQFVSSIRLPGTFLRNCADTLFFKIRFPDFPQNFL